MYIEIIRLHHSAQLIHRPLYLLFSLPKLLCYLLLESHELLGVITFIEQLVGGQSQEIVLDYREWRQQSLFLVVIIFVLFVE